MTPPPLTKLRLRIVECAGESGGIRTESVFCPWRATSRAVHACRTCPHFELVDREGGVMVCAREPAIAPHEVEELVLTRRIHFGVDALTKRTAIGAVSWTNVLCASGETTVDTVEALLTCSNAHGV